MIGGAGVVEVDEGEHFSADGFVAYPEDEIVAPLAGFDSVGEGEEEGSEAFGIHGSKGTRYWVRGTGLLHAEIKSSGWGLGASIRGM